MICLSVEASKTSNEHMSANSSSISPLSAKSPQDTTDHVHLVKLVHVCLQSSSVVHLFVYLFSVSHSCKISTRYTRMIGLSGEIVIYQWTLEVSPLWRLNKIIYLANGMFLIVICRQTLEVLPSVCKITSRYNRICISGETGGCVYLIVVCWQILEVSPTAAKSPENATGWFVYLLKLLHAANL